EATGLLRAWRSGDHKAFDALSPLVYGALREHAGRHMRRAGAGHTLAATDLLHEVFLRLMAADVSWQDRAHFFAIASTSMRRILVNHARDKNRLKRGGGVPHEDVNAIALAGAEGVKGPEVVALDAALEKLQARDSHKARIVELTYFGGLTVREIAEVTERSKSSVQRDLDFAKAWLLRKLS
ncbi:MAG: ECF-type sigma factor, partial [Acidobacteriota bacterium]